MTAIELKTSINEDLDVLGIETLEYVSKYATPFSVAREKLINKE